MKAPYSRKGQGLIEACISLPLMMLVGSALALLLYRSMVYYFADYQLHEALICTQDSAASLCKNELQNRLKKFLWNRLKFEVQLSKTHLQAQGRVVIELQPPLQIEQSLQRIRR